MCRYGARPLRRLLDEGVLTDLSLLIMSAQLGEQQTVVVGWEQRAAASDHSDGGSGSGLESGELTYTVDGLRVHATEEAAVRQQQHDAEEDTKKNDQEGGGRVEV